MGVIKRPNSAVDWSGTDFGSDGYHTNSTQEVYQFWTTAKAVRTSVPSFSDFAIGYSFQNPLPLELTTFTVSPVNDDALLWWNTASEVNSDFFAVERSVDGVEFAEIGTVSAAGFSLAPNDYSFIDPGIRELQVSRVYYRLRMVDTDGTFAHSAVRWLALGESAIGPLLIYPNPFTEGVSISWYAPQDGSVHIQVADASGRIVTDKIISVTEGNNFVTLGDLSALASGVYVLRLTAGNTTSTVKLVKQ
jgi:hypothetical protein